MNEGAGVGAANREVKAALIEAALRRLENSINRLCSLKKDIKGESEAKTPGEIAKTPCRPLAEILLQLPAHLDGIGEGIAKEITGIREMLF